MIKKTNHYITTLTILLFNLALMNNAFAQDHVSASSIAACAKISLDKNRLSCFDRLAALLTIQAPTPNNTQQSSTPADNLTIATAQTVAPNVISSRVPSAKALSTETLLAKVPAKDTAKASFGREHKLAATEKAINELEFTIKSAKLNLRKKWRLVFENGQVWYASESNTAIKLKSGDKVIIRRGAFNSFSLKKKGAKRKVRIKRMS